MNQRIEFGRQRTTLVSEPKKAFGTDFPDSNGCQPFPALIRPRTVSQGPTNVRESVHTCAAATRTSCVGLSMAIATRVSTDGKDPKRMTYPPQPNESRLSCGALKNNSFHNLRAPPASSAC